MKIKWDPFCTPLKERVDVFLIGLFAIWVFWGEVGCSVFTLFLLIYGSIFIKTIVIMYLIYIFVIDKNTCRTGGWKNGSQIFKNWSFWKRFRDYFPSDLVKTADLPADRNYIFGAFPHGITSLGTFANLSNNASPFKELFPGIRGKIATLNIRFKIPIFREVLMAWGMITVSKESLKFCLSRSNDKNDPYNCDNHTSNAVIILVGGAAESFHSRPNNYVVVLSRRKGFVRLAFETGSSLVPVITFGEVDLYDQMDNPAGSKLRKFQDYFKDKTGIAPVVYLGRGFLQQTYGIIPKKRHITTVVGAPIDVKKCENPSEEEIDRIHKIFCNELSNLFETHKSKYLKNYETTHLIIE